MPQQTTQPTEKQTYFSTLKEKLSKAGGGYFDKIKEKMGTVAHAQRDLVGAGLDLASQEGRLSITRDAASGLKRAKDAIFGAMTDPNDPFRAPGTDISIDPFGPTGGLIGAVKKPATVALKGAQSYAKEAASLIKRGLKPETIELLNKIDIVFDARKPPEGFKTMNEFLHYAQLSLKDLEGIDITGSTLNQTNKLVMALQDGMAKMDDKYKKILINNPFGADVKGVEDWSGTKLLNGSMVDDMSISKKPTEMVEGSKPSTAISGGGKGAAVNPPVQMFGTPPSNIARSEYVFHNTNPKNLEAIATDGLKPGSYGDTYFAPTIEGATKYGGTSGASIRIKREHIG